MAGVAPLAGVGRQMALMAELRWRLFWNSLRTWRGRLELVSRVLLFLLAGLFVMGIGFGLGRAASFFVRRDAAWGIEALLWVVFGVWQLFPWFAAAATTQFEFRGLLRFPLCFPSFFLLSLSYGLFDPAAVIGFVWLGCIGSGICLARPGLLPTTCVVLGLFAAMNVLLNRVVFSWLERWLARLIGDYADRVLAIDRTVAEEWGRLSAVRTVSVVDLLLAATARVHGLTLVTRSVRDIAWTGVACLNPFEPQ